MSSSPGAGGPSNAPVSVTPPDNAQDENDPQRRAALALSLIFHRTVLGENSAYAAVNCLLQGPYFDANTFRLLYETQRPSLETFSLAFAQFSLTLVPRVEAVPDLSLVASGQAYLCCNDVHWFGLRRIGAHWVNLNHNMQRPAQLASDMLGMCFRQLEDDGHEIYAVIGKLPPCAADSNPLFHSHFDWGLVGGLFPSGHGDVIGFEDENEDIGSGPPSPSEQNGRYDTDDEEYARRADEANAYMRLEEEDDEAYEGALQAAIAASLEPHQSPDTRAMSRRDDKECFNFAADASVAAGAEHGGRDSVVDVAEADKNLEAAIAASLRESDRAPPPLRIAPAAKGEVHGRGEASGSGSGSGGQGILVRGDGANEKPDGFVRSKLPLSTALEKASPPASLVSDPGVEGGADRTPHHQARGTSAMLLGNISKKVLDGKVGGQEAPCVGARTEKRDGCGEGM